MVNKTEYLNGRIVNCAKIREEILEEVRSEIDALGCIPTLAIISVGDDDASAVYVNNKIKTCHSVGIHAVHIPMGAESTQGDVARAIKDSSIFYDAVMLQLPIPKHLDANSLINLIPQDKDVDGLTDLNMGMLVNNRPNAIVPATAQGVLEIIQRFKGNDLSGVNIATVNRSQLIGKPLQAILTNSNGTATVCHSKTDLPSQWGKADVIVTGIGKPKHFQSFGSFEGELIIDCGICRDQNGKLCGDIDTESVLKYNETAYITPVPRGVGLLTVACLMKNVLQCYKMQAGEVYNTWQV